MTELFRVEIPKFITHIQLSSSRRAKHFTRYSKIPKKYSKHKFNKKGILVYDDGTPIVKNTRTVGTPRIYKINGQDIYSGVIHPRVRSKVVRTMKEFFLPHFMDKGYTVEVADYPVIMEMEIHTPLGEDLWDIDNKWIYSKVIQDVIKEAGIIADDSVIFVKKSGGCEFVQVEKEEDRKIVVKILSNSRENDNSDPRKSGCDIGRKETELSD